MSSDWVHVRTEETSTRAFLHRVNTQYKHIEKRMSLHVVQILERYVSKTRAVMAANKLRGEPSYTVSLRLPRSNLPWNHLDFELLAPQLGDDHLSFQATQSVLRLVTLASGNTHTHTQSHGNEPMGNRV